MHKSNMQAMLKTVTEICINKDATWHCLLIPALSGKRLTLRMRNQPRVGNQFTYFQSLCTLTFAFNVEWHTEGRGERRGCPFSLASATVAKNKSSKSVRAAT